MPGNPETVMPDPLEWLAFLAALTSTVRLGTSVVVLTLHSPAVRRQAVGDARRVCRVARMMLGVGIGWQVEEYAAVGCALLGARHAARRVHRRAARALA